MYNNDTYFTTQFLGFAIDIWHTVQSSFIESVIILGMISFILGAIHLLLRNNPVLLFWVKNIEAIIAIVLLLLFFSYINSIIGSLPNMF